MIKGAKLPYDAERIYIVKIPVAPGAAFYPTSATLVDVHKNRMEITLAGAFQIIREHNLKFAGTANDKEVHRDIYDRVGKMTKKEVRKRAQELILMSVAQVALGYQESSSSIEEGTISKEICSLFGRLAKSYGFKTWADVPIERYIKGD